jgi:hypothetical protein
VTHDDLDALFDVPIDRYGVVRTRASPEPSRRNGEEPETDANRRAFH